MHNHYYEQKSSTLWLILWWFSPLASVWSLWSFSTSTLFFPFTVVSLGFTCELLQDKVDLPHNFLYRNKTCPHHWLTVAIDARSQSCSVGAQSSVYVLSLCGRFSLSTQKGSCWPPSQAFPVSDFPFLHTKINKRQRRLRNKDSSFRHITHT